MVLDHLLLNNKLGPSLCSMSLSYCVGLVYRHTVLVRGIELSNDVEADVLVKLSVKHSDRGRIVTFGGLSGNP